MIERKGHIPDLNFAVAAGECANRDECPGCVGRGTGGWCCMCGLRIPDGLLRGPDDLSEFPGVPLDGWPFNVADRMLRDGRVTL